MANKKKGKKPKKEKSGTTDESDEFLKDNGALSDVKIQETVHRNQANLVADSSYSQNGRSLNTLRQNQAGLETNQNGNQEPDQVDIEAVGDQIDSIENIQDGSSDKEQKEQEQEQEQGQEQDEPKQDEPKQDESKQDEPRQDDQEQEEEEDDEPPKLKYSRINELPSNFFIKDPISSCFFQDKYFVFATHSGFIHICTSNFSPVRTFKAHRASVLSTYTDGQFFASASMDGTVVIGSIDDEKDIIAYDFQRPVHAIVLDSNYASKRSFISGGMSGKVIYSRKNWLGKKADYVIDQNHGAIVGLTIVGDLVIWMNDKGINVFHLSNKIMIKVLEKPSDRDRKSVV